MSHCMNCEELEKQVTALKLRLEVERGFLKQAAPSTQPAVPDYLNPKDENPAYAAGWNDCRQEMLKWEKSAPVQEPVGEAKHMNGVSAAHTQAIFLKSEVPVGTMLYTTPHAQPAAEVVSFDGVAFTVPERVAREMQHLNGLVAHLDRKISNPPAAQPAPVQEQALPEFFAALEYNSPDWDVFACVYRRRADATPELVHREQLPSQAPASTAAPVPWNPSKEQFTAWCKRHGMQPSDRDAFNDAATLYQLTFASLTTPPAAQPAVPYGWVRMNPGFNSGVFHLGTECPPGWVGSAVQVSKIAAPEKGGPA